MKRNVLFLIPHLFLRLTTFLLLYSSLHLVAMDNGCFKSQFESVDRAELLEYYKTEREEARQDREEDNQSDAGEFDGADSGIDSGLRSDVREKLKAKLDRKLSRLFNAARRAVLAEHLPEQVSCVLDRVRVQQKKLYRELKKQPLSDTDTQREELERELMRIMLFELCAKLGQESQDLADMSRGQDGWKNCCKCYWVFAGAATLLAVGVTMYAPFAPCVPWHG